MKHEVQSFSPLVGSDVEILLPDQSCFGPVVLEGVTEEGVRFQLEGTDVSLSWEEIVQISPATGEIEPVDEATEAELAEGVVEMDSEP